MSNKKQTAVEWLINRLNLFNITKEEHYKILYLIELEAKKLEKQDIKDAFETGANDIFYAKNKFEDGEQYYTQTYEH